MEKLLQYINKWFINKEEYLRYFIKVDTRLEGWFKGELILLLNKLKKTGVIDDFFIEKKFYVGRQRKQVDFYILINNVDHILEMKALCISQARGTPRNLKFYFRNDNVGLIKDFKKLNAINHQNKWVIAFIYPNPSYIEWNRIILPKDVGEWKCITQPINFPDFIFIALWKNIK